MKHSSLPQGRWPQWWRRISQLLGIGLLSLVLISGGLGVWSAPVRANDHTKEILLEADFSHQDLTDDQFTKAQLRGSDFSHSDLRGVSFFAANLENTNFEGANLSFATLDSARFVRANLTNAILEGAFAYSTDFPSGPD